MAFKLFELMIDPVFDKLRKTATLGKTFIPLRNLKNEVPLSKLDVDHVFVIFFIFDFQLWSDLHLLEEMNWTKKKNRTTKNQIWKNSSRLM